MNIPKYLQNKMFIKVKNVVGAFMSLKTSQHTHSGLAAIKIQSFRYLILSFALVVTTL